MQSGQEIKKLVAPEMKLFEEKFKESMQSKVALLDKITHYIVKRKGKQMRPMFVFLVAKVFGEVNERTYRAASLIELLHTATLVHDDVVDDAAERRGFFSINALWKNKIAVLVGDYLLSRSLLISVENQEFDLLKVISDAVRDMSEGELLQIEKSRRLNLSEEVYFKIIQQKTASLISSCCRVGGISVNTTQEQTELLHEFGTKVGLAFQIKDDLFDYGVSGNKIGKPTGIDIKEKKTTLPLIYALKQAPAAEARAIKKLVLKKNLKSDTVKTVLDFVQQHGGIDYAIQVMHQLKNEALSLLNQMPQNEARNGLEALVNYTINREK